MANDERFDVDQASQDMARLVTSPDVPPLLTRDTAAQIASAAPVDGTADSVTAGGAAPKGPLSASSGPTWDVADAGDVVVAGEVPGGGLAATQTPPALPGSGVLGVGAPSRRRRRWPMIIAVVGAVVLAAGGAAVWLLRGQTDAHYLEALKDAHVAKDYPNNEAAVAHGKEFCRQLVGGRDAQGYASEKIAVRYYCKSFLPGFKVIPTPAEQQAKYLQALRDGGFGGEFPSDAAAVAHAKSVCTTLKNGGKQQGMQVDLLGVTTYCTEFAPGFHVLEVADVDGTFALRDSDPSLYFPSITTSGGTCEGSGGYSDIHAGTQVIVTNGAGKTLARTELGEGEGGITSCVFDFHVKLTEGEDDYAVTVSHRGEVHFTFEQLQTNGAGLSLGS